MHIFKRITRRATDGADCGDPTKGTVEQPRRVPFGVVSGGGAAGSPKDVANSRPTYSSEQLIICST